ncbi:MAG: ribulose-phosphate 3-epimerase [Coriobacteriia bacterium]|nr:ribulose-phosphate 3-epimerase [Coriobacteriia bacterium]
MRVEFSPSLLSADFMRLAEAVRAVEAARPEWLHVDVMDGHFVPNLTIGPPVVRALKAVTDTPLDVHLMVSNPEEQLDWYLEAGADLVTVHLECGGSPEAPSRIRSRNCGSARGSSASVIAVSSPEKVFGLFERAHAAGRLAGLAINPGTPAELALPFLSAVDLVLVMSVHPGFGGQGFMASALEKLRLLSSAAAAQGLDLLIEVDGGINEKTAALAVAAGANLLVAGTAVLGAADPAAALERLRAAAGAGAAGGAADGSQLATSNLA